MKIVGDHSIIAKIYNSNKLLDCLKCSAFKWQFFSNNLQCPQNWAENAKFCFFVLFLLLFPQFLTAEAEQANFPQLQKLKPIYC